MLNPFKKIKQLERKIEIYECEKRTAWNLLETLEKENRKYEFEVRRKISQIKELRTSRDRLKKQVEDSQAEVESWKAYVVKNSEHKEEK